jgi:hypothetical protein
VEQMCNQAAQASSQAAVDQSLVVANATAQVRLFASCRRFPPSWYSISAMCPIAVPAPRCGAAVWACRTLGRRQTACFARDQRDRMPLPFGRCAERANPAIYLSGLEEVS